MTDSTVNSVQSYHHGNVKKEAIQTALGFISESGLSRLSLREVAARIGVTHTALYRYFSGKEALLAAIAEEGFEGLTAAVESARKKQPNLERRLYEAGSAYVEFALQNPDQFRLMFSDAIRDRTDHPHLDEAARRSFSQLTQVIDECYENGVKLRHKSRQLNVLAAWSMLHGLSVLLIERQFTESRSHARIRFLTRRFLELLLP